MRRPSIMAMTMVTLSSAVSFLAVVAGGESSAREVVAHLVAARDEEVVCRMAGFVAATVMASQLRWLIGVRELVREDARQHLLAGHLDPHDPSCEFLVVGRRAARGRRAAARPWGEVAQQRSMGHLRAGSDIAQRCPLVAMLGEARTAARDDLRPARGS